MHPSNKNSYKSKRRDVTYLPAELTDKALVRRATGSVVEHALLVFLSSGDVDDGELVRLAAVTETLRQLHAHVTSTYRLDYSADRQCSPVCL